MTGVVAERSTTIRSGVVPVQVANPGHDVHCGANGSAGVVPSEKVRPA